MSQKFWYLVPACYAAYPKRIVMPSVTSYNNSQPIILTQPEFAWLEKPWYNVRGKQRLLFDNPALIFARLFGTVAHTLIIRAALCSTGVTCLYQFKIFVASSGKKSTVNENEDISVSAYWETVQVYIVLSWMITLAVKPVLGSNFITNGRNSSISALSVFITKSHCVIWWFPRRLTHWNCLMNFQLITVSSFY